MNNTSIQTTSEDSWWLYCELSLGGLRSALSKKQYAATYNHWYEWSMENGINPFSLNMGNVKQFLLDYRTPAGTPPTLSTRSAQLSHLRKLVEYLAIHDDRFTAFMKELKFMKVPDEDVSDQTYESPTLSPTEVRKVLNAWAKQDRPLYIRNQSVISLTFATGLRISEIAKIQWKHININEGSLRVVSGKGKKSRSVVIVDQGTDAIADLIKWRDVSDGYSRIYVYCPVYKGDNLGPDRPIGRSTISHIVENTSKLAGVELTHHSGRKTLLTELSRNDVPVSDLLAQSGHARADTLMEHYVKPADVDARRKRVRTRWKR